MVGEQRSPSLSRLALAATIHCLTGSSIGEVLGMVMGTGFGLSNGLTIVASIFLVFLFGCGLTMRPLLQARLSFGQAARLTLASDTVSITSWKSSTMLSCSWFRAR